MIYLIVQIFILLLVAGLLGLVLGWYLTRISAANSRSDLQARLRASKNDAKALRSELDALSTAKKNGDIERRLLSDELADLRAQLDAAERTADPVAIAADASGAQGSMVDLPVQERMGDEDVGEDNLQKIKGIGPKIAEVLRELGVRRFEQIATWTPEDIDWVNERLRFKGRIEREEWIPQARALVASGDD